MAFGDADASTPAFVKANSAGKNATTASFTPPAGALLVAFANHDTAGGNLTNTSVITDSTGGTLTWTIRATVSKQSDGSGFANGHLQVSTAVVPGGGVGAITVTTTGTNTNNPASLYCRVITGADTTTPMDATPVENTNTNGAISVNITTVTDGARVFLAAIDWNLAANMTAGTNQTAVVADGIGAPDMRVYVGVRNAVTSPAGSVTMSTATPTTGNTNNYVAVAIRPAAGGPTQYTQTNTGSLTPAAVLVRQTSKLPSGTVTPAGAVTRSTAKTAAGATTPTGALVKQVAKTVAGSVTPAGALTTLKAALRSFAGSLTPAGALTRQTGKALGGSVTPAGAIQRSTAKLLAGAIVGVGSLVKQTAKHYLGAITPTGAVATATPDAVAKATSAPTVSAADTSSAAVTAGRTSTSAVTARATSSGGVT